MYSSTVMQEYYEYHKYYLLIISQILWNRTGNRHSQILSRRRRQRINFRNYPMSKSKLPSIITTNLLKLSCNYTIIKLQMQYHLNLDEACHFSTQPAGVEIALVYFFVQPEATHRHQYVFIEVEQRICDLKNDDKSGTLMLQAATSDIF